MRESESIVLDVLGSVKPSHRISLDDLKRIPANAAGVRSKAMELTDTWGAMFVLDREIFTDVCRAMGFTAEVGEALYQKGVALSYVKEKGKLTEEQVLTWHAFDAVVLTVRGVTDLPRAMSDVNDGNLGEYLSANSGIFAKVMNVLPKYSHHHMFSPEVASNVLAAFGASVSPDLLYSIAPKYGAFSCVDLEGRRGVSTQFIRSVTLTLSAAVGIHD